MGALARLTVERAIWKFVQAVGPAYAGAVTHPGFAGEEHVYADI